MVEQVAGGELQLHMFAKALADGEVKGIARHLVAVGHFDVFVHAFGTSHTYDAFADAIVEKCDVEVERLAFVEESRVDEVG